MADVLKITTVSRYIHVLRADGTQLSQHLTVEDAIEAAANAADGEYLIVYPARRVIVSKAYGTLPASPAPAAPANLVADTITAANVTLSWDTSEGATSYQLYRDGVPFGAATVNTAATDNTVVPSTAYSYAVQAFNSSGASPLSDALAVTTSANSPPVWTPIDQTPYIGQAFSVDLASMVDEPDGQNISFSVVSGTVAGLSLTGSVYSGTPTVVADTDVTFRVSDGYDTADVVITFSVTDPDVVAPSVPTGVAASASGSTVTVSWSSSTDSSGISAYRVYRDGILRGSVLGNVFAYQESGVADGTYLYTVDAVDNSYNLNASAQSTAASVTVSSAVLTPDLPIGFTAVAGTTSIDLSWAPGPNGPAPTDYDIEYSTTNTWPGTNLTFNGAGTTYTHTGLTAGSHYYRIEAKLSGVSSGWTYTQATIQNPTGAARFTIPANTAKRTFTGSNYPLTAGGTGTPVAGDIIELASGTHGELVFSGLVGALGNYITIRCAQSGARTTVRKATRSSGYFLFTLSGCKYVRVSGYRPDLSAYRYCGLLLTHAPDVTTTQQDAPTAYIQINRVSKFIEVGYVNIFGGGLSTNPALSQTNIGIQVNDHTENVRYKHPGEWVESIYIHHNWLNEAGGMYIGANYIMVVNGVFYPDVSYLELPLKNITIEHNLIEYPRQEGIGGKMWWDGNNYIRYNTIHHTGQSSASVSPPQRECLSIQGLATISHNILYASNIDNRPVQTPPTAVFCRCDNGPVEGQVYPGYNNNQPYVKWPLYIYNNLVYVGSKYGISINNEPNSPHDPQGRDTIRMQASVFNNTVSGFDSYGIYTQNVYPGSFIRNNITRGNNVAFPSRTVSQENSSAILSASDNDVSKSTSIFVNPSASNLSARDYHLNTAVPRASGSVLGTDVATDDLDGVARVLATADMGAYEKI